MLGKLASCVLALGLAGCITTTAGRVDNSPISLEERFYQVAFLDEETGQEWDLDRRTGTFHVAIRGGTAEDHARIQALLERVGAATGLEAAIVPETPTDVLVEFVTDAVWNDFLSALLRRRSAAGLSNADFNPTCTFDQYVPSSGEPYAVVQIPASHRGAERAQCIAQEVSHATGLTFDTDGRSDTVFGGASGADHLTAVDLQLLRILYDPRLQPGMTWEEARPIVRRVIAEIQSGS